MLPASCSSDVTTPVTFVFLRTHYPFPPLPSPLSSPLPPSLPLPSVCTCSAKLPGRTRMSMEKRDSLIVRGEERDFSPGKNIKKQIRDVEADGREGGERRGSRVGDGCWRRCPPGIEVAGWSFDAGMQETWSVHSWREGGKASVDEDDAAEASFVQSLSLVRILLLEILPPSETPSRARKSFGNPTSKGRGPAQLSRRLNRSPSLGLGRVKWHPGPGDLVNLIQEPGRSEVKKRLRCQGSVTGVTAVPSGGTSFSSPQGFICSLCHHCGHARQSLNGAGSDAVTDRVPSPLTARPGPWHLARGAGSPR
eukprot:767955-Hanusia_phi.AAC.15